MLHYETLVLTLEVKKHLMKLILMDLGSAADLLYLLALLRLGYNLVSLHDPERILVRGNGSQTSSLGEIVLLVSARLVTTMVTLTVINDPLSFNANLGHT